MRVTSDPSPSNEIHRVMPRALHEAGTADIRVGYDCLQHDRAGAPNSARPGQTTGVFSILLLSADGTGGAMPVGPTTVAASAPSLALVSTRLDDACLP